MSKHRAPHARRTVIKLDPGLPPVQLRVAVAVSLLVVVGLPVLEVVR